MQDGASHGQEKRNIIYRWLIHVNSLWLIATLGYVIIGYLMLGYVELPDDTVSFF